MSAVSARLESARLQDLTRVTSQQADVEPSPAKNRDKGDPAPTASVPHQRSVSRILPPSLLYPSISVPSFPPSLAAYLAWLLNCAKVAFFPPLLQLLLFVFPLGLVQSPGEACGDA